MTVERRSVLRNLSRAAAAGAVGPLLAACADGGGSGPEAPRGRASAPGPGTTPDASAEPPSATSATSAPSRPAAPPVPGAAALPADLPEQIQHGPRDRPLVALTFHGQGEPAVAEALLAAVERAGAHITVFAVGSWLDAYPAMARRVLDAGHELGNHTQNHGDISAMSAEAAYREIDACARRLRRLTGSIGSWFRPSQAPMATAPVLRQARRAGYRHCLSYDVDSLDYTDPGPAAVRETVLGAVGGGSVVSLHLGHPGTVGAMPSILDGLRSRGLRAVTATELLRV